MEKTVEQIMKENNIHNQLSISQLLLTDWIKQFNEKQIEQIKEGLEKGLNVSIYAKPEFNYKQMSQIRWGLEDNLDVSAYAKPELNWKDMETMHLQLLIESIQN